MARNGLSILVHSASKTGKSTLAASAPRPALILDAEGGTKFLPNSKHLTDKLGHPIKLISWNPVEAPPAAGDWDAAIVHVTKWEDVQLVYRWLVSGQHGFRSLVIDSITEVQRRLKTNLVGTEQMQIQSWGQLLTKMDAVIRGFRDLANDEHNSIQVVVFIAETRQTNGKWSPYLQGQIAVSLGYFMDLVGYLYVESEPDADGQDTIPVRKLLVSPHPQFEAGERVQGAVGPVISNPDVEEILAAVYPHAAKEAAPV